MKTGGSLLLGGLGRLLAGGRRALAGRGGFLARNRLLTSLLFGLGRLGASGSCLLGLLRGDRGSGARLGGRSLVGRRAGSRARAALAAGLTFLRGLLARDTALVGHHSLGLADDRDPGHHIHILVLASLSNSFVGGSGSAHLTLQLVELGWLLSATSSTQLNQHPGGLTDVLSGVLESELLRNLVPLLRLGIGDQASLGALGIGAENGKGSLVLVRILVRIGNSSIRHWIVFGVLLFFGFCKL